MLLNSIAKPRKPAILAAVVAAALIAAPAFAHPGNGGGNGNGNGGGNSGGSNGNSHASANNHASTSAEGSENSSHKTTVASNGPTASSLGALNGFLHASPVALVHASPKSRIGKIATVYAAELKAYLANPTATSAPTLSQLSATLTSAANKPLSPAIIQAVDAKLASTDATLSKEIAAYQGGASGLATAISTAK